MALRFLLLAALVVALSGCGGSKDASAPTTSSTGGTTTTAPEPGSPVPAPEGPLLAASSAPEGSEIHWVDGRTLEPVDGRGVEVPFYTSTATRSPDGGLLAVGESEGGSVQFIDAERMEAIGTADVEGASYVALLNWVEPDLLLASLGGNPAMVAAIDPTTQKVLSAHELDGAALYSQAAGKEVVSLVAPTDRIGPARLVVFDGSETRKVTLADVPAGWEQMDGTDDSDYRARQSVPALAVDPEGKRALVIPAGNRVAEVDLDTMEVSYHDLSEPVSLWGRLRDWIEPSAQAKAINGPDRNAVWLPTGLVAVSGSQYTDDGKTVKVTPAGLVLIDPSDWSVTRLSDEPGWVTLEGDALIASGWKQDSDEQVLIVFDTEGNLRFSLRRRGSDLSQVAADHLYATKSAGTRFEIIDLASGETVGHASPKRETWLLPLDP